MDSRAKQRLTGAVILVALFVLLVPELLTGPTSAIVPANEEEGLRRYTIDLDAPSPGSTPASAPEVALPAVTENASQTVRATPGEAAVPAASPAAPAQSAPNSAAQVPQTAPAPLPADAPAASATPPASAPAPRPEPVRPAATSRGEARSFVVQLGSFGSRDNAERLVRDMTARGFTTFIAPITTNGRELYRVRVGPTRDRASAEALAARLKRVGQSGSIVPIP
jgi:DedD protein